LETSGEQVSQRPRANDLRQRETKAVGGDLPIYRAPLGGAETYLLELLHQLDKTGDFLIDIATLDIVKVENQFHFSCQYERDANFPLPMISPTRRLSLSDR